MITVQEIIKSCPFQNYVDIYLYVEGNCVWDYKEGKKSILLISETPCIENEKVTLQELIDYSNELDYPNDILTLECEQEMLPLKSYEWLDKKLILFY